MMQKTAADFLKLAQAHPFCAGFLITAQRQGLREDEMRAGLLKAAAASPARAAEIDSFLQAAGVSEQVKAAAGWGQKLQKLRNRTMPQDPAGKAMLYSGAAAATAAGGLGAMAYAHRPDGPQPANSRQLAPPQAEPVMPAPKAAPVATAAPKVTQPAKTTYAGPAAGNDTLFNRTRPAAAILGSQYLRRKHDTPGNTAPAPAAKSTTPATAATGGSSVTAPTGPAWYTNPAVLGGGGLLALALLARNMGSSSDSEDDEQDY